MKYKYLIGLIPFFIVSCTNLDESPESNQVEQQFYRNEQDAISAVNAVYEALHNDGGQTLYNSLIQIGVEMAGCVMNSI